MTRYRFLFDFAFALLAIERLPMTATATQREWQWGVCSIRLFAFCLIPVAIFDKNRARSRQG